MAIVYNQINLDNCEVMQKVSFKTKREKYSTKAKLLKKREVEQQSIYHVIGYLKTKDDIDEMPQNIDTLYLDGHVYPLISKKMKGYNIRGYIQVAENDYIAVVKFSFTLILFPFIILLLLVLGWIISESSGCVFQNIRQILV